MSEDRPADETPAPATAAAPEPFSSDALADLTTYIIADQLRNIIANTVESCHRSEKHVRMQSAATEAESLALANLEPASQKGSTGPQPIPSAETPAAKYDNGRVCLKGNPLKTTPEILCSHCKLPRLMFPIMGVGMKAPDLTREYCKLYPFVSERGHDIYGNPFPTDMAKSKKERELIKQQQKNAIENSSVGTPGSQDTQEGGGAEGKEIKALNTGGKPASYIPWHTCPNCKRSLLITRFAQHLEKCIGLNGRQSSRNAMAKLSGQQNGNGSGLGNTPLGSRLGTPVSGSQDAVSRFRRRDDDNDDDDTPERKLKKKKSSYIKKADRERLAKEGGSSSLSNGILRVKLKPNGTSKEGDRDRDKERKLSFQESPEKRERERDAEGEDGAPKAKKLKLSLGRSDSVGDSKEQVKREMS